MSKGKMPLRRENFKKLHRRHNVARWIFSFSLAAACLLFLCTVWFAWVKMGNDSVAPTLQKGDLVLVNRMRKYYKEIERTDMVAFYRPGTKELLIKRVVATGGESVQGQNGSIWIDEKYCLSEEEYGATNGKDFDLVKVPEGYVFVLSDDRQFMEDSREEGIGCIDLDNVVGVMEVRLLPAFAIFE